MNHGIFGKNGTSKTWPLLEDLKRVLEVRPKPTRDNRSKHGKRGLLSIGTFGRVE